MEKKLNNTVNIDKQDYNVAKFKSDIPMKQQKTGKKKFFAGTFSAMYISFTVVTVGFTSPLSIFPI